MTGLAVGDLVAPLGATAKIFRVAFRVAEKYPQFGYVCVQPYRRSGGEQILYRIRCKGRQIWTDGRVEWIRMGRAA